MNKFYSLEFKVVGSNLVIKIKEIKLLSLVIFFFFLRMNDIFWIFILKGFNYNMVGLIFEIFF